MRETKKCVKNDQFESRFGDHRGGSSGTTSTSRFQTCTVALELAVRWARTVTQKAPFCRKKSWRVPNPPLANPLVAERAFRASEFWGLTGVSEVHGK